MKIKWLLFPLCFLMLMSCKKEVKNITVDPVTPVSPLPGPFTVTVTEIQNTQAIFNWTEATGKNSITYEISLDDSVIAFDLTNEQRSYLIKNLLPDKDYTVSVTALTPDRVSRKVSTQFHTLENVISGYYLLFPDKNLLYSRTAMKMSDGGFLVAGYYYELKNRSEINYIAKVSQDFDLEWTQTYTWACDGFRQCRDGNIIAFSKDKFYKIEQNSGSEIWNYSFPAEDDIFITNLFERMNGELLITGFSGKDNDTTGVTDRYLISRFTSYGTLINKKFGGTQWYNYPFDLTEIPGGKIIIFGRAQYTGSIGINHTIRHSNWLLELDQDLNFLSQHFYPNGLSEDGDIAVSFLVTPDNSFMLFSTTYGLMNGYDDHRARLLKVNPDFSVSFDRMYNSNFGETVSTAFVSIEKEADQSISALFGDEYGLNILSISTSGEVIRDFPLHGPEYTLIMTHPGGPEYILVTREGYFIRININGSKGG